jgi:hypothetical protein
MASCMRDNIIWYFSSGDPPLPRRVAQARARRRARPGAARPGIMARGRRAIKQGSQQSVVSMPGTQAAQTYRIYGDIIV